jgi:uncharacterized membrane protein YwaF
MPEGEPPYIIIGIIVLVVIFLIMIIFAVEIKPEFEFGPFGFIVQALTFLFAPRV